MLTFCSGAPWANAPGAASTAPTNVRRSIRFLRANNLAPTREAHRASRAGQRPVTRNVIHQSHGQTRFHHGAGHGDPVLGLGRSRLEPVLRKVQKRGGIALLKRSEHGLIEGFIDYKMS